MSATLWSIPSPASGVWYLGPVPIRAYALCIIAGVVVAIWIAEKRWVARGGRYGDVQDVAVWAVPFGLVGSRIYHVATDWELYFGDGRNPVTALYLWKGGLGIWGAVAFGALGTYIGARRKGIKILPLLDAMAPTVLVAQAFGRFGNYFNQELYGRPTDLPWGLEIDPVNWPGGVVFEAGTTFHPTFLYEALWNLVAFAIVIALDKYLRLGRGQVLATYVMAYTAGRAWIEDLRIDTVQLDDLGGLRFNSWMAITMFLLSAAYFAYRARQGLGREREVYRDGSAGEGEEAVQEPDEAARD